MNNLEQPLIEFGLSPNETKVYLAALELGETTISRIAKKSQVKRATTYLAVSALQARGFLSASKKGKRSVYFAQNPKKLIESFDEKRESIMRVIPELLAIANAIDVKPRIQYFEGKAGVEEVFKDILRSPSKEVLEWYSESYITDFDENFFSSYFTPERIKRNIHVRAILPDVPAMCALEGRNTQEMRQTKLIDPAKYHIRMELNVYDKRKVSLISFKEEFGIIIESEIIHDSLKNLFELMWEYIPE
ncbi:MAG: helix-turn-helix domain-containing protein [bacterium]|nr:helix-turn-helix domain-containing protein [bacterium]